jgi:hypothetical protein
MPLAGRKRLLAAFWKETGIFWKKTGILRGVDAFKQLCISRLVFAGRVGFVPGRGEPASRAAERLAKRALREHFDHVFQEVFVLGRRDR